MLMHFKEHTISVGSIRGEVWFHCQRLPRESRMPKITHTTTDKNHTTPHGSLHGYDYNIPSSRSEFADTYMQEACQKHKQIPDVLIVLNRIKACHWLDLFLKWSFYKAP